MINDARTTFALPKHLLDDIKRVAAEQNISMASLIKIACTEYVKKAKE